MLAREIWALNKDEFIRRFKILNSEKLCAELFLYGSVARGEDNEGSDLDLLVTTMPGIRLHEYIKIKSVLTEWIDFDVHISFFPQNARNLAEKEGAILICQ